MLARRQEAFPQLSIALPQARRRSSLLSPSAASPRTPRSSVGSPHSSVLIPAANRKSTSSWGSSIQDDDGVEYEWKSEQTLLLTRTLEALPTHLYTPFNGALPPSNLLDKIARGVVQAKGSVDWPHSVRATRVKLLEIARTQTKEAVESARSEGLSDNGDSRVLQTSTNLTPASRRPIYRQSSMDFLKTSNLDVKNSDKIARLSNNSQQHDRVSNNSGYHPYQRPVGSNKRNQPSQPTTPSHGSPIAPIMPQSPLLRRQASFVSSLSSDSSDIAQLPHPTIQRIRHVDSVCNSPLPVLGNGSAGKRRKLLKHIPSSFGSPMNEDGSSPSSDEEEKVRSRAVKKARVKSGTPCTLPLPSTPSSASLHASVCTPTCSPVDLPIKNIKSPQKLRSTAELSLKSTSSLSVSGTSTSSMSESTDLTSMSDESQSGRPQVRSAASLRRTNTNSTQRSQNIFGGPLPSIPASTSPAATPAPATPMQRPKTLRRVAGLSSLGPARRIEFGDVSPGPAPENSSLGAAFETSSRAELGSAFQLN